MKSRGVGGEDLIPVPEDYRKLETVSIAIVSGFLFTTVYVVTITGPTHHAVGSWFESQVGKSLSKPKLDRTVAGIALRLVTCIHNMIVIPLAVWGLLDASLWEDPVGAVSTVSQTVLGITTGFFVFDACACALKIREEGFQFLMHGVLCATFFLYTVWRGAFHFFGCAYLLWEFSTAFVHIRWMLYKLGHSSTKIYLVNGLALLASFFSCRILWGSYISLKFFFMSREMLGQTENLTTHTVIWVFRGVCVGLNGLNWYWFGKMVEKAFQLFVKKESQTEVFNEKEE